MTFTETVTEVPTLCDGFLHRVAQKLPNDVKGVLLEDREFWEFVRKECEYSIGKHATRYMDAGHKGGFFDSERNEGESFSDAVDEIDLQFTASFETKVISTFPGYTLVILEDKQPWGYILSRIEWYIQTPPESTPHDFEDTLPMEETKIVGSGRKEESFSTTITGAEEERRRFFMPILEKYLSLADVPSDTWGIILRNPDMLKDAVHIINRLLRESFNDEQKAFLGTFFAKEKKDPPKKDPVDLNVLPVAPEGYRIAYHIPQGYMVPESSKGDYETRDAVLWDPKTFNEEEQFFSSKAQRGRSASLGSVILLELLKENKVAMNATMLDWLLKNPEQIPGSFKGRYTFFWGTLYTKVSSKKNSSSFLPFFKKSTLYVRGLHFSERSKSWETDKYPVNGTWNADNPALLASWVKLTKEDKRKNFRLRKFQM